MRTLALAGVLLAAPLTAQGHQPPHVSAATWSLPGPAAPTSVQGRRTGLSGNEPAFSGTSAPAGDFALETTLIYRNLADGDVAGIALRGTNGGWISLQLEQITPALLIAVRRHVPGGVDAQGKLLATTAVPGWHEGTIRLKIERRGGVLHMAHAAEGGTWQLLGPGFADPTGGATEAGLFAVDGAER
jgi:hypothetical protein